MSRPRLILFRCLPALFLLAYCACGSNPSGNGSTQQAAGGAGGAQLGGAGGTATGGHTSAGSAGAPALGGATGVPSAPAGGSPGTGGTRSASGGAAPWASTGGGYGAGGTSSAGGASAAGGAGGATGSGATATGGTTSDSSGVPLAKPGDSTSTSKAYLNLGDMRLLNNRWGSDALSCNDSGEQKVYINSDGTLGYSFNRPTCGGKRADPDYPEVEFGVAPFGANSTLLTSPPFSSTTLLPIQLSELQSASVTFDTFASTYQNPSYYDTNFEFWISKSNPLTTTVTDGSNAYAEIISFLGWNSTRMSSSSGGWSCDQSGNVTAGTGFNLCHQSDAWSPPSNWRFFNFNLDNGPVSTFSSKVDVYAMLQWVMTKYSGFTSDMWLTRIEVGTEVDDNTQGSVQINNLTFEINGTSKSVQLAH